MFIHWQLHIGADPQPWNLGVFNQFRGLILQYMEAMETYAEATETYASMTPNHCLGALEMLQKKCAIPFEPRIKRCSALAISKTKHTRPNFTELLSTKICLSWNFFLDKNRITNQIHICWILLVTGSQLLIAYPENHVKIWLVILFLLRKKFHAQRICVLSSSLKMGPGLWGYLHVINLKQTNMTNENK